MGILNVATYVTVDGQYVNTLEMNQYQNKIRFLQLTGTSGTLTSEQINLLRSDNTNYIIVDNELYNCNDLQDANGYLVYTHTGADASNNVNIKTLSITLNNNNWSIQTTPVQPKIPVANTNEAVQFAEDERQKSKNLLDINKVKFKAGSEAFSTLSNGTITINAGNMFCYTSNLIDLCNLKPNIPYTLSYVTSNGRNYIYQYDDPNTGFNWSVGETKIFTQEEINKIGDNLLLFYGSETDVVTYSNIQIEEGSVATDYQPYNGAIVHEKDIADVEHIETIYDMSSSDSNINKGYTSGLMFTTTPSYKIMSQSQKNKYKYFRVTAHLVNTNLIFEFMNEIGDAYARGGFACQASWLDDTTFCFGHISIAPWGSINGTNCRTQNGSTVTDKRDDTSYYISKIEGALL